MKNLYEYSTNDIKLRVFAQFPIHEKTGGPKKSEIWQGQETDSFLESHLDYVKPWLWFRYTARINVSPAANSLSSFHLFPFVASRLTGGSQRKTSLVIVRLLEKVVRIRKKKMRLVKRQNEEKEKKRDNLADPLFMKRSYVQLHERSCSILVTNSSASVINDSDAHWLAKKRNQCRLIDRSL